MTAEIVDLASRRPAPKTSTPAPEPYVTALGLWKRRDDLSCAEFGFVFNILYYAAKVDEPDRLAAIAARVARLRDDYSPGAA